MSIHNNKALVAKNNIIDTEIMEQLEPIYVSATMQIVITPEARDIHLIAENTREIKIHWRSRMRSLIR